jgi:hypothetical protein
VFLGGEGVELTADRVHLLGDPRGTAVRRALEQQMFEVVRGADLIGRLVARTSGNPHTDRRRAHPGHPLGDHP